MKKKKPKSIRTTRRQILVGAAEILFDLGDAAPTKKLKMKFYAPAFDIIGLLCEIDAKGSKKK